MEPNKKFGQKPGQPPIKKPAKKEDPELEKIIQEDLKHLQLIIKQCKDNFQKVLAKYGDDMPNLKLFWNAQSEVLKAIQPNEFAYKIINTNFIIKESNNKIFVIEDGKDAIQFELNKLNKELFKEFIEFCKGVKTTITKTVKTYKSNAEQAKKRDIVGRIKNI